MIINLEEAGRCPEIGAGPLPMEREVLMTGLLTEGRCAINIHEECRSWGCVCSGWRQHVCSVGKVVLRGLSGRCGMQQDLGELAGCCSMSFHLLFRIVADDSA